MSLTAQPSSSQRNLQLSLPLHFNSAAIQVASSQSYSPSTQSNLVEINQYSGGEEEEEEQEVEEDRNGVKLISKTNIS